MVFKLQLQFRTSRKIYISKLDTYIPESMVVTCNVDLQISRSGPIKKQLHWLGLWLLGPIFIYFNLLLLFELGLALNTSYDVYIPMA